MRMQTLKVTFYVAPRVASGVSGVLRCLKASHLFWDALANILTGSATFNSVPRSMQCVNERFLCPFYR